MFKINLIEGIKNIGKNKKITLLSVILFTILFLLQGYAYSYYAVSEAQSQFTEHSDLKNYQVYRFTGPYLYRMLMKIDEAVNIDSEKETSDFYKALDNIEHLKYLTTVGDGFMPILEFKGGSEFLMGYYEYGPDVSCVFSFDCGPTFHKAESYRIIDGRDFTDEDMIYVEGKPQPVLLGYKYKGIYNPGDIITLKTSDHQGNDTYYFDSLEVLGILAEDTTVMDAYGTTIYDLDNFIVFPGIYVPYEENSNYEKPVGKIAINQQWKYLTKIKLLVDSEYEKETLEEIQTALNEYSCFAKYHYIFDNKQYVEKMHSRTEAVTQFAFNITAVLMVASLVTIVFSVINRIENNLKDYAIHISLGASFNGVIGFVISEMAIILGCSMVLGLTVTKLFLAYLYMPYDFCVFLGIFAVTSLLVIILSAITAKLALKKYDLYTLIK